MTRAYVGLGSNIEPEANIRAAVRLLATRERVIDISTFYRTESIPPGAPSFINGAVALETSRRPRELKLGVLRGIEARLGRVRTADRNAPRTIDCDLLAYGDDVMHEGDLVLPAPEIESRAFVAVPLLELDPDLVAPISGRRLADIAEQIPGPPMIPLVELTGLLRKGPGRRYRMDQARVESLVRQLLIELGEDPEREGLLQTPKRVAASFEFLVRGQGMDLNEVVHGAIFEQDTNDMIVVRDIELYSLCEHHILPFFGRCHIGYIAKGKVLGASKLARIVDVFAHRLQIQERLTNQIAHAVLDAIGAQGVGVVIEAQHLCMMMRGVEKQNSLVTTSSVLGSMHDSTATRAEFLSLVGKRHPT